MANRALGEKPVSVKIKQLQNNSFTNGLKMCP